MARLLLKASQMISEEQKAEAKGHGIIPGAVIQCAVDPARYGTVSPYSEWRVGVDYPYLIVGIDNMGAPLYALSRGKWATVKTPAPPQGLQPRDACKCGPAMRAAIAERAKELGLWSGDNDPANKSYNGIWVIDFDSFDSNGLLCPTISVDVNNVIPAHEFLKRLENTSPPVKELTTEEKLEEAVKHVKTLVEHAVFPYDGGQLVATNARAFLKSIKS